MILSSVVVTPSKEFYGLSGGGSSWLRRNFYIVFVNTILDIVKGGYWLWPIQETRRFDSTKEIGINNFDIWNIHDRKKKLTLDSSF